MAFNKGLLTAEQKLWMKKAYCSVYKKGKSKRLPTF
jgi:hypothetical protein